MAFVKVYPVIYRGGWVHHGINPEVHDNKWRERHPNSPKTPTPLDAIHGIRESVPRDLSRGRGFFTAESAEYAEYAETQSFGDWGDF